LQGDERQEDALAGTGRTDHQGMANITDVQRQPKWGRAIRLGEQKRRAG
jgi:hypothetical protein